MLCAITSSVMASNQEQPWLLENGNLKGLSKENRTGRTAHNMSSSSLRKKSDLTLVSKIPCSLLRQFLTNLQEVMLGTKLSVLFPAIPLAIVAQCFGFARVSTNSLLGFFQYNSGKKTFKKNYLQLLIPTMYTYISWRNL